MISRIRSLLNSAHIYDAFTLFVCGREGIVKSYLHPKEGDSILDIGCGTGIIVQYLPDIVKYRGWDISQEYIQFAKERYRTRPNVVFECKDINRINDIQDIALYDIVVAVGVLHHLKDEEAGRLCEVVAAVIKPEGRFVTADGCYAKEQSMIARYLLSKDRGKYVRDKDGYISLVSDYFGNIKVDIRHDMCRIPTTSIIMECSL
ncbi:MAG: class I SAM-dependent methyltransferase [Nitrospirae bacterium]|nr:class I SAM-dependent methyltransferase [Nitrospirota bacterium]